MKAKELLALAVVWLDAEYPGSIIVTELSVSDWGGASIDVAAITKTAIVGVEIKGEGDSPARLELQGHVYGRVARKMWLLADESIQDKCFQRRPRNWARLEIHEGGARPYNRATKAGEKINLPNGGYRINNIRDDSRYDPEPANDIPLLCPYSMCGTLWRDELYDIARLAGLFTTPKIHTEPLTEAICNQLPAPTIHKYMVAALRARIWKKPVLDRREQSAAQSDQLPLQKGAAK